MLAPYTVIKMLEKTDMLGLETEIPPILEPDGNRCWTRARVADMATDAIADELRARGVAHSQERFLSLAADRTSAWSIIDAWTAEDPVRCDGTDADDFLGLAACELWKRWIPDRPSIEMLDDWMQEGYEQLKQNVVDAACDIWWRVWQELHPRFEPAMTTMDSVLDLFNGMQSVFNWSQDFDTALINASRREPRYAEIGREYCEQWQRQFTDEEDLLQVNIRRSLAGFLFRLGEVERAEATLHESIQKWPSNMWGYIALADEYAHAFRKTSGLPRDLKRAEELLEQGLAVSDVTDRDREVFRRRLDRVREELGETDEAMTSR